ncbi:MAG: alkaline phosphatase family protein [Chthoniobacterales bacterium]
MAGATGKIMTGRRAMALGLVPLALLSAAILSLMREAPGTVAGQPRAFAPTQRFRTVVLILDSAGESEMFDPDLMPFVTSLRKSSLSGRSRSCAAKATFPCIKSIFEGREATMGTTLQDFSAFPSHHTTWPASLASLGLRLVVASDHTLNRLYPHAFVDSLNYEDLHVPLLERDSFVYRKARQWLDDTSIDVLILHIVGTDKVSHEYPVRGPVYREKYREVDEFVREVAGRLQPNDYLFAISDHGHNELGGHTEDAGYVARGPFFPPGLQQNLDAEDMLFLLSVPYGLTMPADYQGQIRLDLMQLAPELHDRWLAAQAGAWRVRVGGLSAALAQRRLNEEIDHRSHELERELAIHAARRSAPFWFAAALFLVAQLRRSAAQISRRIFLQIALATVGFGLSSMGITAAAWLIALAAFLHCANRLGLRIALVACLGIILLGATTFWLFPASLTWLQDDTHRRYAFIIFYVVAIGAGWLISPRGKIESSRARFIEILWVIGIAVWLLAYFGPLGYSLTRHASLIVLGVFPILAVMIAGGFRAFLSPPALLLPALVPVIWYDVESYNIKYPIVDRIAGFGLSALVPLCAVGAILLVFALRLRDRRATTIAAVLTLMWLALGWRVFQFDLSKLAGGLLACLWFAGCLALFQSTGLPTRWMALITVVFCFILLTFFLNGFALSHVDFRFATNKIFPFAREVWRAPQLIFWAIVKYSFALLPIVGILRCAIQDRRVWGQMLLLGWWRELTIVAGALGLAVFNARGMRELCSEEIYFWTFLNLFFLALSLVFSRPPRVEPAAV